MPLGLMIEIAVAVLLATTIGYCIVLNKRIRTLQSDRAALQQMIADLVQATSMANSAIKGLRETAVEADEKLNTRLNEAERFAIELANHVNAGQAVMDRIAKITQAARSPGDGGDGSRAGSALKTLKDHQKRREHAA
ncbi:DUF6468 domain-containing protein [Pelagibacterium halotolerans]|uniref:DUF6468 domain-containing protein n=1 Tax=Pelagibacterium halotolerans (strain DSM 22347 / JCM 15775 / CGMCC 1.7692 / B2) TaxID=1082931 RepID=G4REA6_PELHB|nr:DUF6468 domain-containing protein [Pelagibacterium halotolerans]AEQ51870.1 hypothetical protein KKY_1859 [Pelagibacterium halotolerans B2]QJR18325.1 chemotaxis protein [Pelagibacterium halotolerans]SEA25609.1 hypothetical protein SAMN05428936_102494 [Pelagibacterium halotolerans]